VSEEIDAFIGQLRERPWIDPELVDLIAHGLRTAASDPNPVLWEKLREVISDEDEFVEHQLTQIGSITAEHRGTEQARHAAGLHAH
jgi:hypothetical protein